MNGMRKLFCFLVGVVLAAISLQGIAASQTKYFSATFPVLVAGGTSTIQVKFYNATPKGVSTINSISITTPNANVIINTGASSPGTWTFLGTAQNGGNVYEANNFTGIQNGQTGTFNVSITDQNATDQCVSGTWGATANAGNSLNGDLFNDVGSQLTSQCSGALNCGDTVGNDPPLNGTAGIQLHRGNNIDGGTCSALPYASNFITSGTQTFAFLILKNGQQVSTEYVMAWAPVSLPASGWNTFRPTVSWGTVGHNPPVVATTDYVPALACLSEDLNNPSAIMPMIPNDCPNGPYCTSPYTQFQPNQPAKMCIAEQDWALVNVGTTQAPVWKIQYLDVVIDQSDSHVTGP